MVNSIEVLKSSELLGQQFTVFGTAENPYFVATQVSEMLSLTNVSDMINRVDIEERSKFNLGRQGKTWFLTEDGLYEVLMQSRKPIAKQFKKGVKEILKSIRRTGGYLATAHAEDHALALMSQTLQMMQQMMARQDKMLELLTGAQIALPPKYAPPRTEYVDYQPKIPKFTKGVIVESEACFTVKEIAAEYGMTAHALHMQMAFHKVMYAIGKEWYMHKEYEDSGFHCYRRYKYGNSIASGATLVITAKGKEFINKLMKEGL